MAELRLVFSGETGTEEATSIRFNGASFIYIENNGNNLELEIDAYLQIYISNIETRKINLSNLREINLLNTLDAIPIPLEYSSSQLDMSIVLVSDFSVNVSVYVLITRCICATEFEEINEKLDIIAANEALSLKTIIGIGLNELAQNLFTTAITTGITGLLAPVTGGASAALLPPLLTTIASGTTALLAAGLFLPE